MRRFAPLLLVAFFASVVSAGTVNPPVRVSAHKADRSAITGQVTRFDDTSFDYTDAKRESHTVLWDELDPANVYSVHAILLSKATGDDWFALGKKLAAMKNGKVPADRAFARAVRLDPTLKDKVEAAKRGDTDEKGDTTRPARQGEPEQPTTRSIIRPGEGGLTHVGGATTRPGAGAGAKWPALSEAQQAATVKDLKAFAEKVRQEVRPELSPYETKYFLFYSDMPESESRRWAAVLDSMYARLGQMFAVPKDENIWRGKALVFVFGSREDFTRYEKTIEQSEPKKEVAGRCHPRPDGDVRITFYRQPDDLSFARLLVHESTHGFEHRYRSPIHLPLWANEGLAEYVSYDLVQHPGITAASNADAKASLQSHKDMTDFFAAADLEDWQYPVARTLTQFMIQSNRAGYIKFVQDVKDGIPWKDALKQGFGKDLEQLVAGYGQGMGVDDLGVRSTATPPGPGRL